ncbi:short-chain dehydrogenase [Streptomyces sp. NBC_01264]|uniref:short-chain dehydrogenase n=1 Tax=Streptomyces sp. NBC_01264 TaxID=2903804 RepID=UPI003D2FEBE8
MAAARSAATRCSAATALLLATSPLLEGIGGRYFADCNGTGTVERRTGNLHGVARYALDPDNARRLWTLSGNLLAAAADQSGSGCATNHL